MKNEYDYLIGKKVEKIYYRGYVSPILIFQDGASIWHDLSWDIIEIHGGKDKQESRKNFNEYYVDGRIKIAERYKEKQLRWYLANPEYSGTPLEIDRCSRCSGWLGASARGENIIKQDGGGYKIKCVSCASFGIEVLSKIYYPSLNENDLITYQRQLQDAEDNKKIMNDLWPVEYIG
jgi:hypothetical protein